MPTGAARLASSSRAATSWRAGEVTIKDLIEGERLSGEIADNQAWREGRPAQFSVPESELVEAVRSVLARHGKAAS